MDNRIVLRFRRVAFLIFLGLVLLPIALVARVAIATRPFRYTNPNDVPAHRVAIIFGAGVKNGMLTPMLADRVDAGIELYQLGRVQKLLMTGDNSRVDYDEVSAMKQYAVERGVPAKDITLDYAGFRTYDSCYRARVIFGLRNAVLVTQRYHLPRAIYTCRMLGMDVVGLGTPDWEAYPRVMGKYALREKVATLNALWELHITHPLPTFLGPFVGIGEE